jgi:hypothetical protein
MRRPNRSRSRLTGNEKLDPLLPDAQRNAGLLLRRHFVVYVDVGSRPPNLDPLRASQSEVGGALSTGEAPLEVTSELASLIGADADEIQMAIPGIRLRREKQSRTDGSDVHRLEQEALPRELLSVEQNRRLPHGGPPKHSVQESKLPGERRECPGSAAKAFLLGAGGCDHARNEAESHGFEKERLPPGPLRRAQVESNASRRGQRSDQVFGEAFHTQRSGDVVRGSERQYGNRSTAAGKASGHLGDRAVPARHDDQLTRILQRRLEPFALGRLVPDLVARPLEEPPQSLRRPPAVSGGGVVDQRQEPRRSMLAHVSCVASHCARARPSAYPSWLGSKPGSSSSGDSAR